jgi:alpha-ketoglutaric semialdehyde dehydrogenase
MNNSAPILVNGAWQISQANAFIQAVDPRSTEPLPTRFPVSPWPEIDAALTAAQQAFEALRQIAASTRANFLDRYAARLESRRQELCETAHQETGLPVEPRLNAVELPRTCDQLRQAAAAVRERTWCMPTIDAAKNIRSLYIPLGLVLTIGPNNFPFAYNSVAGGDFASALAAGCPVLAKGHPAHPKTTQLLAQEAAQAVNEVGLPPATVQMLYHVTPEDGLRWVSDSRTAAIGFTGSRPTGLALKKVADEQGKPIFLEMGSLNPVVLLPGAIAERPQAVLDEVTGSCLAGMGQFCTNPGLLFLLAGSATDQFLAGMVEKYRTAKLGTMLTQGVRDNLAASVKALQEAGAELVIGGKADSAAGFSFQNTLLRASGKNFVKNPLGLQREAFGNATLAVVCHNVQELKSALQLLEGQLCGSIYSHPGGQEDALYAELEPILRQKVGRLLNDKMTTGVAVTAAMNHGGPFPATGHPHFTAVGFPPAIRRFCMLACYDNVRPGRLPEELRS